MRLIRCTGLYTTVQPGTRGTVVLVDDAGTIHIRWDDGRQLGIIERAGNRIEAVKPGDVR